MEGRKIRRYLGTEEDEWSQRGGGNLRAVEPLNERIMDMIRKHMNVLRSIEKR